MKFTDLGVLIVVDGRLSHRSAERRRDEQCAKVVFIAMKVPSTNLTISKKSKIISILYLVIFLTLPAIFFLEAPTPVSKT